FDYQIHAAPPSAWEQMITQTDNVLKNFVESDKGGQGLRRYRGLARTRWVEAVSSSPDDAVTKAKDDIEAALSADPKDAEAMATLCEWYQVATQRARARRDNAVTEKLDKEGHDRVKAFLDSNGAPLPVLWAATIWDIEDS